MILEVAPDQRPVGDRLDQPCRQVLGGTDPRQHQELRRVVGAAAQDHLALGAQLVDLAELLRLDADRARALEEHPLHVHYGLPLDTNTRLMFYSEALLTKAGVSAPPATFDAFQDACTKVKALGGGVTGFSEGGTGAWNILPWV